MIVTRLICSNCDSDDFGLPGGVGMDEEDVVTCQDCGVQTKVKDLDRLLLRLQEAEGKPAVYSVPPTLSWDGN